MTPRLIDLAGQEFKRWTVLYRSSEVGAKITRWRCLCSCGTEKDVASYHLLSGLSGSCGCVRKEKKSRLTHGDSKDGKRTSEYGIWDAMTQRCTNPKNPTFPLYGGRGIGVCDDWLNGRGSISAFEAFLEDMGRRPSTKHSIDRIDNYAGYSRENCRWATQVQQARNKRNTIYVTIDGDIMPLADAADRYGVPYRVMYQRNRMGKKDGQLISKASI